MLSTELPGERPLPRAEPPPPANRNAPRDEPAFEQQETPPRPTAPTKERGARKEPSAEKGSRDFIGQARRLASYGIRYNGAWTPPGESDAWVMDCSNTCRWVYREAAGVTLPRTASDQYVQLDRAGLLWKAPRGLFSSSVNVKKLDRNLRTGDLLFWENTYKPVRHPDITHVMLFLGEDKDGHWFMAGSQASKGVAIYEFDPNKKKGGYKTFFGLFKHEGKFVAYGRPLGKG